MIIHYKKSHWNLLDTKERRAIIAMFQSYIKKQSTQSTNTQDNKEIDPKEDSHE